MHTCACFSYVFACMHMHACVHPTCNLSADRPAYLHTSIHPSIHPCRPRYIHASMYTCYIFMHILYTVYMCIYATSPRTTTVRRHDTVTNPPAFRLLVYDPRLALLTLGFEVPKGEHIRQPPSFSIPCDPSCRYSEG